MSVAAGRRGEPFQRKSNPMQDVIRERKGGRPKWNEMSKVGSCETKKPLYCSFNAKTRVRIGSGFTWRKRWARLSGGHGPKSVLLSLCLLKTSSAAEILVITDPNADRSVDREFDFLGSHVDVLSAVHLHPEERPSAASRSIRPLKPLGRCQPTFGACTLAGLPLLRRRAPNRHGRGVDYSIALVERLSAFFIMLIGFEWVRPRLTPGT